jgi:putative peptide maturation system protein
MSLDLPRLLTETVEELTGLADDGARPAEARARMKQLLGRHPGADLELVWEEEAYDGSVHYDALLHLAGAGTVSVSFCPERSVPWPLRGVQRWSDADLMRVNSTVLKVNQAIALLDFVWNEAPLVQRLIDVGLIHEELEREPVELTDADLQSALDAFRRAQKLYTAADARRWLEVNGLSHGQLEEIATREAELAKLRDRVTAGRVEDYFAAHRADFDTARFARFACADAAGARRAYDRLRGGRVDFYTEAEHAFAAAEAVPPRFEVLRRGQAPAELAAVFAAEPGDVLAPIPTAEGHLIVRVIGREPARLDGRTRAAVKRALFEVWLAERRRSARVEWYWGTADQAAAATA